MLAKRGARKDDETNAISENDAASAIGVHGGADNHKIAGPIGQASIPIARAGKKLSQPQFLETASIASRFPIFWFILRARSVAGEVIPIVKSREYLYVIFDSPGALNVQSILARSRAAGRIKLAKMESSHVARVSRE